MPPRTDYTSPRSGTWRDTAVAIKQLSLDEDRDDAEAIHEDFLRETGLWVHLVRHAPPQECTVILTDPRGRTTRTSCGCCARRRARRYCRVFKRELARCVTSTDS